ncbi:MAG TPA: phosphoribosylglycinamide synthetase C domain-containing protein [Methylomirabilota bacterium]|nr:phosphoribosylglycinamide synthetase C domain-containing protein [Methylomirabilota bacterium]
MNILIIDPDNSGLDFAWRCGLAGHRVKWFQPPNKQGKFPLDGIGFEEFEKVEAWIPHMKWAKQGLIVNLFNTKYTRELDEWKKHGFPIFSPSVKSAALEIKRGEGMRAFEQAGIEVPHYQTFDSLKAAEQFARKQSQGYVFKTLGDEEDKSLSYVASDPADLVARLQHWQKLGLKLKGPCMLQEKIDGIEMGVAGWIGPSGFLPDCWNENFEFKKLMPGDHGPNTGEQGTVEQYVKQSLLAERVLAPLEDELRKRGHIGDVDINVIIDRSGTPWPLEFTCRFGWPDWWIRLSAHRGDPAEWMRDLLQDRHSLKPSYDVAVGVVLSQPEYPYSDDAPPETQGVPIWGMEKVLDQVHPVGVMIGQRPEFDGKKVVDGKGYVTTREYVMCVTALGKTVCAAAAKCYDAADQIKIPNKIVRDDIGERLEQQLPELHRLGYAKSMDYGSAP